MDRGRIVDDGPPNILAMRPGPYRDLLRKQQLIEPLPEAA
jgi:ATP-binding cassette subfamily B protein